MFILKSKIVSFVIFSIFILSIHCKLKDGDSVQGKCVFIVDDSAVYDFHPLKADKDTVKYTDIKDLKGEKNLNEYGWFINLCNDTIAYCYDGSKVSGQYDSQLVYRNSEGRCIRLTGAYHKGKTGNLVYHENKKEKYFEFEPREGDKCDENSNYKVKIKYLHNDEMDEGEAFVEYKKLYIPSSMGTHECTQDFKINVNLDSPNNHLLVQRLLNNYNFLTGPLMILIGFYLCLFAQNKKATKFVVSFISCQILVFVFAVGFFGIGIKYLELVFLFVGGMFGVCLGYFCLGGYRLFRVVEAACAGFIFGLYIFDILFSNGNYQLTQILLVDTILVFVGLFVIIGQLVPEYHIFFDSITGSYIFTRGLSALLYKVVRYRELQLIIYLVNRFEMEYADYYRKQWDYFWLYDIFIFILMGTSIFNYIMRVIGREEDDEEKYANKKKSFLMPNSGENKKVTQKDLSSDNQMNEQLQ